MALQVVEAAEDLKLLEAETAQLRGKMPLRQAALKAARHEGEAGEGGEVKKEGGEDRFHVKFRGVFQESLLNPSLLFSFGWKKNDCSFIFKAICATFGLLILGSPLEELREMVTSWQSKLEPLRRELQMKVSQKGIPGFWDDDFWVVTPKKEKVSIVSRVLVITFSCFLVFGKNTKDLQRSSAWGSWSDGSCVKF